MTIVYAVGAGLGTVVLALLGRFTILLLEARSKRKDRRDALDESKDRSELSLRQSYDGIIKQLRDLNTSQSEDLRKTRIEWVTEINSIKAYWAKEFEDASRRWSEQTRALTEQCERDKEALTRQVEALKKRVGDLEISEASLIRRLNKMG